MGTGDRISTPQELGEVIGLLRKLHDLPFEATESLETRVPPLERTTTYGRVGARMSCEKRKWSLSLTSFLGADHI